MLGRKGLDQQHAVRHALHRPVRRRRAGDVDNREGRIDLSRRPCHPPAVEPAHQLDVGHQRTVFGTERLEQGHGLFARARDRGLKAAIPQGILKKGLDFLVVFDDQDHRKQLLVHDDPHCDAASRSANSQ